MTETSRNILLASTVVLSITTVILILEKSGKSYSCKPTKKFNNVSGAITEYKTGLANTRNPWLFPKSTVEIQQLTDAAGDLTTYSQLAALTWLKPIQENLSYRGLTPWEGPPDNNFCFEFEMTRLGWYFMYGHTNTMRFTLMIFFLGLNAANPESPLYSIVGGYEDASTKGWITIPHNGSNATYSCDKTQNVSFTYPVASEGIITSNGVAVTFMRDSATKKMVGSFSVTSAEITIPHVDFTLSPTKKPNYNGPNSGCGDIGCFGTLGTLYWSYTNPVCTISSKASPLESGGGWFDHQNISAGIPRNVPEQILFSFGFGGKMLEMPRWLWLTAQLTAGTDKQYMITANEIKMNILPFQPGQKLACKVNRYNDDGVEYGLEGTLEIKSVMKYTYMSGYEIQFPTKYLITVKDDNISFYLTTNNTGNGDTVIMPSGNVNWEGPGTVTDLDGKRIGTGFLEANQLIPVSVYHQTIVNKVNGPSDTTNPLPKKKIISNLGTYVGIMVIALLLIFSITVVMTLVKIF